MKKGRPKGNTGKARVLDKKEIEKAISMIKQPAIGGRHSHRDSTLLAASYYLGLRAKELAGLTIKDILDDSGYIAISIKIRITKGNRARTVYLPESLREIFISYIESLSIISNNQPLFRSQKGSAFTPNTMQSLFKRIFKKCLLSNCSSHSGRRSFATRLIEEGADIKAVSSLMGHTSINMTAQYVEDNPMRLKKMVNNLL
jgi:integrase/recombinase XerD